MLELTTEDRSDIQGFILSAYGHMRYASFVFLQIRDAAKAKVWLAKVVPTTTTARPWPTRPDGKKEKPDSALNIAFTHSGLKALALSNKALDSFPREFIIGQAKRHEMLGDIGDSAPEHWQIGGPNNEDLHILVLLYGQDADSLDRRYQQLHSFVEESNGGIVEIAKEDAVRPENSREPFGFRDGISQPEIEGTSIRPSPGGAEVNIKPGATGEQIKAGDFILGYPGEYDILPPTPGVPVEEDPQRTLPPFPKLRGFADLGRNGTYVVYRKLEQDVAGFWGFIERWAEGQGYDDLKEKQRQMRWLAAKFVGRWPSGTPLAFAPDRDEPSRGADSVQSNSFTFLPGDKEGYICPVGSHIRRSNPRDAILGDTPEESLRTSRRHRILRRATPYGSPMFPEEAIEGDNAPMGLKDDGQPRGLHFFAINTDIKRQFEFVQQEWVNNASFNGLFNCKDPLIGDNDGAGSMILAGRPLRIRIAQMPRFVHVKGGAYFFLPSITALRFLANDRSA
jgi:deferrochelatase/peroxidase EfeB